VPLQDWWNPQESMQSLVLAFVHVEESSTLDANFVASNHHAAQGFHPHLGLNPGMTGRNLPHQQNM